MYKNAIHNMILAQATHLPFNSASIFAARKDEMMTPIINTRNENVSLSDYLEKATEILSDDGFEWMATLDVNGRAVTFRRFVFKVPETYTVSCKGIHMSIQPQNNDVANVEVAKDTDVFFACSNVPAEKVARWIKAFVEDMVVRVFYMDIDSIKVVFK